MYPRLLVIILMFDRSLASALAPMLLGLSALSFLMAGAWYWFGTERWRDNPPLGLPANPLGLGTSATFAVLFVVVSIASSWAMRQFGTVGIYALAAVVGVSDINPFVLNLAQHGAGNMSGNVGVIAVLVATASNNVFKAVYAPAYSSGRIGFAPTVVLTLLAACGIGMAVALA